MTGPDQGTNAESAVNSSRESKQTNDLEYVVRFGAMRILGVMKAQEAYRYGDQVIARTDRGTELGTVLCEATPTALDVMHEPTAGKIVRRMSRDDSNQWDHIQTQTREDLKVCQKCIDRLRLTMDLVDVERLLGGERVVVYYVAEGRVDFRQLVRELASEFQTRIEMRQIGVRDEAKLLADYGDCGQPLCCATFLSKMPPVSMKMAKLQRSTLDPTKISGRCGRLKCCLRYEFETYEALAAELPPVGAEILTREGAATVLAQDILSQQLMVRTEDKRRILIAADLVVRVTKSPPPPKPRKSGRRS
ncbi:signal peptidase [Stieleria sp. TO1_6]|uniref:PSP1 domain-containing protein n=1 Tax=Stieleria tagensis TaxID=2956795 RepID=UPI00209AD25B|nr:regulatory iron-sulfur-containing complex subunit RicT [Stieleria tagensis]MCO8123228.1 signal peptidase [Stieleria tagensis]